MNIKNNPTSTLRCGICNTEKQHAIYTVKEKMLRLGCDFFYFECSECGCLQIKDIPDDLSKYYPSHYYSFNGSKWKNPILRLALIARNKAAIFKRGVVGQLLNIMISPSVISPAFLRIAAKKELALDTRILDVGCGTGILLQQLAEIGFTFLRGVDPYIDQNIDLPNNAGRVFKRNLSDLDGTYDIIMFNHSLEHMTDQAGVVKNIYRLLADDGLCMIRIPVVPCFAWKRYKENWVQLDAPRHLFLHSLKSIEFLASNEGFFLEDVFYDSTSFQIVGSEKYENFGKPVNGQSNLGGRIRAVYSKWCAGRVAHRLNLLREGDQAAIYLKKRARSVK
jgi:2-polyprenyl-3-methyl-5-hydroxy-6-metoxy-1,4-benzoquinol methylase